MTTQILQGDALAVLRTLPSDHFHCVVTSPPYWGLRDYGTGAWEGGDQACDHTGAPIRTANGFNERYKGKAFDTDKQGEMRREVYRDTCGKCGARRIDQQIGLEQSPDEWCARLVEVFREVRRVLRPDGVCFVNIGDSYAQNEIRHRQGLGSSAPRYTESARGSWAEKTEQTGRKPQHGCKAKDLIGQPWLLAFALRADGWWLRSEIIWAKSNPMPESVTDRPTKSHEQVFLLTKSARYFWDAEAVREPGHMGLTNGNATAGRQLRSVWTIATDPLPSIEVDGEKLDHFSSYPIELARRCILAGTSAKGCCPTCGAPWARVMKTEQDTRTGWRPTCSCIKNSLEPREHLNVPLQPIPCRVLDPFGGSGRTALAAEELDRDCTLIELNPASVRMATAQLERAKALRMIGDVAERITVPEGQLRLFG